MISRRNESRKILAYLLVIAFGVVALAMVANLLRFSQQLSTGIWGIDFTWESLDLMCRRQNPYAVFLEQIKNGTEKFGTPNYLVSGFGSMLPLGLIAVETARWVWLGISLITAVGILLLLQKSHPLPIKALVCVALAFFASAPLRIALLNSQVSLYVIFLFLMSVEIAPRRPWLSGLFLCLSMMKYSLTLPLAVWFGLKHGRLRAACWAAVWQIVLTATAAWWMRCGFMDALLGPLRLTASGGIALGRVASDLFSISSHAGIRSMVIPGVAALLLLGLAYVSLLMRRKDSGDDLLFGFLALLSCLLFFHLPYDHVILILPLWAGLRLSGGTETAGLEGFSLVALVFIAWLPSEIWVRLESALPPLATLGSTWWRLGLSELVRFASLVGLLCILLPLVLRNWDRKSNHIPDEAEKLMP